jgi:hypothetical protein
LSGHDGQSVASLRAGFQQSKAAVKGGSLSGWRPSGRYFYRDSKHRLTIGTNLPGGGKSVKIFWYTVYGMPNWLLTVGLLIYPTIAFIRGPLRRWSQRRRHRQGLCTNCGYDLTGNTSGVCPECGHAV